MCWGHRWYTVGAIASFHRLQFTMFSKRRTNPKLGLAKTTTLQLIWVLWVMSRTHAAAAISVEAIVPGRGGGEPFFRHIETNEFKGSEQKVGPELWWFDCWYWYRCGWCSYYFSRTWIRLKGVARRCFFVLETLPLIWVLLPCLPHHAISHRTRHPRMKTTTIAQTCRRRHRWWWCWWENTISEPGWFYVASWFDISFVKGECDFKNVSKRKDVKSLWQQREFVLFGTWWKIKQKRKNEEQRTNERRRDKMHAIVSINKADVQLYCNGPWGIKATSHDCWVARFPITVSGERGSIEHRTTFNKIKKRRIKWHASPKHMT